MENFVKFHATLNNQVVCVFDPETKQKNVKSFSIQSSRVKFLNHFGIHSAGMPSKCGTMENRNAKTNSEMKIVVKASIEWSDPMSCAVKISVRLNWSDQRNRDRDRVNRPTHPSNRPKTANHSHFP